MGWCMGGYWRNVRDEWGTSGSERVAKVYQKSERDVPWW